MKWRRIAAVLIVVGQVSLFLPSPSALCNGRMPGCFMQEKTTADHCSKSSVAVETRCPECVRKNGDDSIANTPSCTCCLHQNNHSEGTPPESAYDPASSRSEHRASLTQSGSASETVGRFLVRTGRDGTSGCNETSILQLLSLLRI